MNVDNQSANDRIISGGPRRFPAALISPGMGDGVQRYLGHLMVIGIAAGAIWFTNANLFARLPEQVEFTLVTPEPALAAVSTAPDAPIPPVRPTFHDTATLTRRIEPHTNIPARSRREVLTYTVESGDTLFGIAEKFGVTPETVLWGNQFVLGDDPHSLRPGQELLISPVNGVLRVVQPGDTIEGLAKVYRAFPDDIINWPGNELDPDNPQLTEGEVLVVPGGEREFVQWVVVSQAARSQTGLWPASAGPGACAGGYTGGAVGTGSFVWPTNSRFLSGNNYSSFHLGLDLAAGYGDPIYAADSGVAIFAGWNNWGYGNLVVLDHGNGWQTVYAHMSQWNVSCGQSISKGSLVGASGSTGNSTGPHLHFEMSYNGSRPNPWNYLP